jgi:hypothetical protein
MIKCEYACMNKTTCTIPIFFELLGKDNTCPCNECVVKVKCVTPCREYKDEINTHLKEAMKRDDHPSIIGQYVEYRRLYLKELVHGYPTTIKIPIIKSDMVLNPSSVTLAFKSSKSDSYPTIITPTKITDHQIRSITSKV